MIDYNALFKITYGLYIVCSGDKQKGNGFISNTLFQVTAEPAQFAACCNKENYTATLIDEFGCFTVSVLKQDTESELIGRFGYKSGKDIDKLAGMDISYKETGAPVVMNSSIGFMECKVIQKIDVGTHWMFIGELVSAEIIDENTEPLTYAYYRRVKKGIAPKNAPTYIDKSKLQSKKEPGARYKCSICGYIHDENKENKNFEDLPNDWKCPVCGADKEDFIKD